MTEKDSEQQTQDFVAEFYEQTRFTLPYARKYQMWFFEQLVLWLKPKGLILDNGCGTGHLAEALPGARIVGVDLSPRMAEIARKRLSEVFVASAESLPFPENHFDAVLCRSLLHHLPHPEAAVAEASRVLKPGGRVLFSDTLKNPVTYLPRELMRRFSGHFSEGHKNFSQEEFFRLTGSHFKILEVHYIGFFAYTLFGFPDVANFQRYIPFKALIYPACLALDRLFAHLPLLRRLAANIVVVAEKSA
jgi:ubiquinone/menaquinone biosynthesis C-methylase UbiE